MIVKVRGIGEKESWRFYDSAREVQTFIGKKCDFNARGIPEDVTEEWFDMTTPDNDPDYACISFIDGTGPRHIITNTRTYIMNDDGKTIERVL